MNSELVPVLQKEIRLIDDLTVELEQLLKKQQLLVSQQTGKIESSWRHIETIIKRIQWVIILLTVISTLFSIAFINWITHRIIQPIKHLATRTEAISNGDLRHSEESVDRSDEIGMLISSINVMSNSLQGLVSQFSVTMNDVAGNAEKISVASRETAQGMNRQASFIDDIRQKVELISTSAAEVENSIAEVTEQSIRSENTARKSFDAVNEALERMGSIKVIFSETAEGIQQLNQAVEQITQVTNMIQEIAEKSQILAINAAIEAARAGKHGKGFMVITEEIKHMSDKTIEATSRVKSNITEIETKTRIAVKLSEKGMSTVIDSADISESARDSFSAITESTNKVAESVRRTTEIAKQQAEQTQLVVNLIGEISDISQQSNHCAEETVHIGSELNHKSNDIQTMLGQFRLN